MVVVSLPHDLHYPVARAALEAGCHVMLEKPMALSMVHVNALLELAASEKKTLIVSDTAYTTEPFKTGRQIIATSGFGEFVSGHYVNHRYYFSEGRPDWFYDPERSGGGQFINIGVHRVAAVRTLLGDQLEESRVQATTRRLGDKTAIETATTAMVCYEGGQSMIYEEYGYMTPPNGTSWSLRLMFERGMFQFEKNKTWSSDHCGTVKEYEMPPTKVSDYCPLYEQLLRAIDGQSCFPTAIQGARDARIALAAYASAREGIAIDLRDKVWELRLSPKSVTNSIAVGVSATGLAKRSRKLSV